MTANCLSKSIARSLAIVIAIAAPAVAQTQKPAPTAPTAQSVPATAAAVAAPRPTDPVVPPGYVIGTDDVLSKVTLPGSIFLALVAILPTFAILAGISSDFANFYGGTSILIMVGVVLDTLQQIESHLLMRHYDGLMKSGRIKGRNSPVATAV